MPVDAPKIDSRDQTMLVEQLQKLALEYCSSESLPDTWKDLSSIQSDKKANTLIHIFARMMEIIINRLNKVPDKNFLTFLDLVGVRLSSPKVARTPLTFTMASGANYYSIPEGIQVAAAEAKGQEAVVFETEKALTVIAPRLVKAVSLSPANDKWTDHSQILSGSNVEETELFNGKALIPHLLYLGHNKLFSFKEKTAITLEIVVSNEAEVSVGSREADKWRVKWYYFDEKSVSRSLDVEKTSPSNVSDQNLIDWEVANLLKSGSITFKPVAGISIKELTGVEKRNSKKCSWTSNWIFAELETPILETNLPKISNVKANIDINPESSLVPDLAFFNNTPLDLSKDFYPFGERPKFNDTFHIGSKEVFSKEGATVTMKIVLSRGVDAPASEKIKLRWESWNGRRWEIIGETTKNSVSEANYGFTDGTKAFFETENSITFTCPHIEEKEINGEKNHWIRVRIIEGNYGDEASYEELPTFKGKGKIGYSKESTTVKGSGTNFKSEIKIGDSIIIIRSIENQSQIKIVIAVISDNTLIVDSSFSDTVTDTEFYVNKSGWTYKPATYKPPSVSELTLKYTFSTQESPEIILTYNDFVYEDYKHPETLVPFHPVADEHSSLYLAFDKNIATLPVTIFFPLIGKTIGTKKTLIQLTDKGTISSDNTTLTGTGTNFLDKLKAGDSIAAAGQERIVTSINSDTSLTVDLPFDPALDTGINFSYTSLQKESLDSPFLTWQYWTGKEWLILKVEDNTNNLTKRELIQFLAPADIGKRFCFDFESDYYWIRATLERGKYENFPSLKGIHTNTVWAHNMITVKDEILGFSNGKPNQTFKFSRSPVLSGQKVLVRELSLSAGDKMAIISEEGENAVEVITDDAGSIAGFWICWHEVKNFYFSNPKSRHYIADPNNGTITFGDGERGMIPPAGKDNIKCSYQSGGGVKGNVQAGTITKLRRTFPYIDSVTNHEAASGGVDKENLDRVRERGPQTLKHRDRAVTYEDFEWLVREASPNVAKVKCLPTRAPSLQFQPGWVTLIIVPESDEPNPLPTQQLVNEIQTYLFERTSLYLIAYPSQINLIGPGYIKVWVEASLQFTSIIEAKTIEARVLDNLQHFFHPLHGGPENKGWNFGRNVYISEVYELIENTDGVDHVDDLILKAAVQVYKLELVTGPTFQVSYPKRSTVDIDLEDGKIIFFLPEAVQKDKETYELYIVGFKEGDQVRISDRNGNYISTLSVKSVLDDGVLECETDASIPIPEGSIVETSEGVRSYTKVGSSQKPDQSKNILLTVATPDEILLGTEVLLNHRDNPAIKKSLDIKKITKWVDTVFIDDNYLVYSGPHAVNK